MPLYRSGLSGAGVTLTGAGNLGLGGATPTYGLEVLGGDIKLDALATPAAPTVVVNSGSGTNYYYYIVAEDRNTYVTVPSAASTVASSSLVPNNTVSWTAVSGATKYYVLRHTAGTLPTAPSTGNYLVATWTSGALSVVDTVATASLGSFTTSLRNTTADMYVDGCISSKGNSVATLNEVFGAGARVSSSSSGQNTLLGNISRQIGATGGTAIGYNSQVSGAAVAVGVTSSAAANSTAVGVNTTALGASATAVGQGAAAAGSSNVCVGATAVANASASNTILIGASTTASATAIGSVIIGFAAAGTLPNTFQVGSANAGILTTCIGHGITDTVAPTTLTLTTTSATPTTTTDVGGGNIIIAGGNSTGTGAGGYVKFQTAAAAAGTGSTANTLVDRLLIDQYGSVVLNAGGAALATNATDGFTYIPTCAGVPSGAPTARTGAAAVVYNTTDNRLCIYNPTGTPAWKFVTLGA